MEILRQGCLIICAVTCCQLIVNVSAANGNDDPVLWVHRTNSDWSRADDVTKQNNGNSPLLVGSNICTKQET